MVIMEPKSVDANIELSFCLCHFRNTVVYYDSVKILYTLIKTFFVLAYRLNNQKEILRLILILKQRRIILE